MVRINIRNIFERITTRDLTAVFLLLILLLFLQGCSSSVRLVGYGECLGIQHGLKVELINNGQNGALIQVLNTSSEIISINQSILSKQIYVSCNGNSVEPKGHIHLKTAISPRPDDFVIIAPGQTRTIIVPISIAGNEYRTIHNIYELEKNVLYDVDVTLIPYFGTFTEKTANETLSKFKIPNYLHKPLMMNSMQICYK